MNTEQQQPTVVNPEDIFAKAFSNTEPAVLPTEPTQEVVEEQPNNELPLPKAEPTIEQLITDQSVVTDYSSKIKSFIDAGLLEDFEINVDGEQVFLSEMNVNDEDTYKTILSQVKEEKERQIKEKYIPKEGIDETTEKLIEIRKAGGDITDIIRENVQAIDQLKGLKAVFDEGEDTEKEDLAIKVLFQDLSQRGLSERVVKAQIQDFIDTGILEDKASEIINQHLASHEAAIENKKQQELQRIAQEREEAKVFKKNLSQTYKQFNIPENISKVLLENATKYDENQITNTDKLYFEARKNPEFYAKLNFFLNNPQEFEKWVSSKEVLRVKKDSIKSSITINTSKVKSPQRTSINSIDDLASNVFNN